MTSLSVQNCLNRLPLPILNLCNALEEKCPSTAAHCRRVGATALELATFSYRFDEDQLCSIFQSGYLHDIGKLAVPMAILDKPSRLSEAEWEVIRSSVLCGESLLKPFLQPGDPVLDAVRHEHERWDGAGYPDGLYGEQIPVASRIVHIADTLDALRIRTAYRLAKGQSERFQVLAEGAGGQFDPEWVELALRLWSNRRSAAPRRKGVSSSVPIAHNNRDLAF